MMLKNLLIAVFVLAGLATHAQAPAPDHFVKENYAKKEFDIPMRDGIKLHTIVYSPKDAAAENKYPFLMQRTCYSVAPYGEDIYPARLGPSTMLMREKYIFVYQDVRGRYKSEGVWTNMTPHLDVKKIKRTWMKLPTLTTRLSGF
jgi:predicted acyl esterase